MTLPTTEAIVFWGATGQAKVLAECLPSHITLAAVFENNPAVTSPFANVPIYYGDTGFAEWQNTQPYHQPTYCAVAIGSNTNGVRVSRLHWLQQQGLHPLTLIHPTAYVSASAALGPGCQVLPKAVIHSHATLGTGCIVNTNATVEHDCTLGHGVHIAPGATLTGEITLGDNTFIGANATVLPRLTVGANAIVGAGAVVTKHVPSGVTVVGNPAAPLPVTTP